VRRRHPVLLIGLVLTAAVLIALGKPWFQVVLAMGFAYVLWAIGLMMLGGLARPVPEPPPAGELRKVRIQYRCSLCGAEVRMMVAPDAEPQPPRHCQEDMDLLAPIE
jgi:hypothetical protein